MLMTLSMVLHAMLLSDWKHEVNYSFSNNLTQTLNLELSKASSPTHKQVHQPIIHKKTLQAQPESHTTEIDTTQDLSDDNSDSAIVTADTSTPENTATQTIATSEIIRNKIASEFAQYFYYPDAARRRNWQGEVVLEFTLLQDGQIDQIRVHHSSGYSSLDEAAVRALQRVKPQLELAQLTDAKMLHVLPVSYRLVNSL